MTHRHHTTGRLCNCGFTKHLKKPQGSASGKFFTSLDQHKQGKLVHNLKWGFPPKRSAADPEFLEQYIKEHGPYMYHGTTPDAAKKILSEGLYPHDHNVDPGEFKSLECPNCGTTIERDEDHCPLCGRYIGNLARSRSPYSGGFLTPRSGHVYLGDYDTSSRYAPNHTSPLLRIDLRKLDPTNISADEDHFTTNRWQSPVVDKVWEYEPPPNPEYHVPGEGQTLGEWADQIGLGNDPEETHHSMKQGSMAYNGIVPPEAIEMDTVHRGWGGVKPSEETGWKAMPKEDYIAQPFMPVQFPEQSTQDDLPNLWDIGAKPTKVFAATDSNHWEGKMWHGNNQGLFGAVRTPFWTTSHKPETKLWGDTSHPVSVRFKNPYYFFRYMPSNWQELAQAARADGVVVKYLASQDKQVDPDPYPDRQWAIALDPGTVVPGHEHEWPYG